VLEKEHIGQTHVIVCGLGGAGENDCNPAGLPLRGKGEALELLGGVRLSDKSADS
jgi:hypothetical protein